MSGHACSNGSRRQPFYKVGEVERICTDALTATGLMPTDPCPIRIERFVEKYFKVAPRYEMLPDNILGFTEFGRNGVKAIVVTSLLDEEGSQVAERRIRTTLAHEAGHGLLHLHLFEGAQKPSSLFDDNHDQPEILCRDVQGEQQSAGRGAKWWEYQANLAIGSLLMPRHLVLKASERFCQPGGLLGLATFKEDLRETAARELARLFDVNPVVARIRLSEVFPAPLSGQLSF